MNIAATQYSLKHRALEIYLSGCNPPHCKGCHNSELWDFNLGTSYNIFPIKQKIEDFNNLIANIWILGGEPLDQNIDDLRLLLIRLATFHKTIWLFTRYDLKDIPEDIKILCDYIKCGRYFKDNLSDDNIQYGIKLASSNQRIYKIKKCSGGICGI